MDTGLIVAIVVVALLVVAALVVLPRLTAGRRREKAIAEQRDAIAHKEDHAARERLERAERAEQEARRERAAAEHHAANAELTKRGEHDDRIAETIDRGGAPDGSPERPVGQGGRFDRTEEQTRRP
jgi:type II secretory pathway pseudopilin PulG